MEVKAGNCCSNELTNPLSEKMNFDIRNAVIHNVRALDTEELKGVIVDSIEQGDEKLLPGLGVLFEVIWNNSTEDLKKELLDTLHKSIESQETKKDEDNKPE